MEHDLTLVADNRVVSLEGPATSDKRFLSALDRATSYAVAGHRFSPAFKAKQWDGRDHLLKWSKRADRYQIPIGLLPDALAVAEDSRLSVALDERRRRLPPPTAYAWNPSVEMRPYQQAALDGALAAGSGILKLATGAGKTALAARLIWSLRTPCLYVVTSQLLLRQAAEDMRHHLMAEPGVVGEGVWSPNPAGVTVASIQTLVARRERVECRKLLSSVGLLVADEVHRSAKGGQFRKPLFECDARHKFGLSATAYLDDEGEVEKGVIYLRAACGPLVADVGASALVEEGWLMRPTFRLYRVREPEGASGERWSPDLEERCLWGNPARNALACRVAKGLVDEGLRVLITARRRGHVDDLVARCRALGLDARPVTGAQGVEDRERDVASLLGEGGTQVLVGSVLREGVNMPALEAVIVADGGKDAKDSMQRLRNLRTSPGKTRCVVVDFIDLMHPSFASHSRARLSAYRAEGAFRFEVADEAPAIPEPAIAGDEA